MAQGYYINVYTYILVCYFVANRHWNCEVVFHPETIQLTHKVIDNFNVI